MKTLDNRYRLLRKIGAGGMGEVYLGEVRGSHGFTRKIAVKLLSPETRKRRGLREAFVNEASILSKISHPNLVNVFDFGDTGDRLYLCMEYIEGLSFREILRGTSAWGENVPLEVSVKIAEKILEGLVHIHERGIVHGDLSPGNIMVSAKGEVKILDFGVSRIVRTGSGGSLLGGKPRYTAPEMRIKGEMGLPSDIYSLGVILREMSEGIHEIRESPGVPGATLKGLTALASECLHPDPRKRPLAGEILETVRDLRRRGDRGFEIGDYLQNVIEEGDTLLEGGGGAGEGKSGRKSSQVPLFFILPAAVVLFIVILSFIRTGPPPPVAARDGMKKEKALNPPGGNRVPGYTRVASLPVKGETTRKMANEIVVRPHEEQLKGTLRVNVNPWARVKIDGKDAGTTPLVHREVPPGGHEIVLENRSLGVMVERKVTIKAGETTTLIEDFLKEKQ